MESKEPEELIVISDLHLSAGRNPKTGRWSRNEDFFFDKQFARFLTYIKKAKKDDEERKDRKRDKDEEKDEQNKNEKAPKKHLIIAGDMFDFLQVTPDPGDYDLYPKVDGVSCSDLEESPNGLGTTAKETIWKLGVIATGHPVFFEALTNFVSDGHNLSIIIGNHDIELHWPKVQEKLKEWIAPKDCLEAGIVTVYPWFYYDKTYKTYIEHGNQYDCLNSFEYLLNPLTGAKSDVLWLPIGSFFVRYFFNRVEMHHPFADNIKPFTKYIKWAWKDNPIEFLTHILGPVPAIVEVFLKNGAISRDSRTAHRWKNYRELVRQADRFALPFKAIGKIYKTRVKPITVHKFFNASLYVLAFLWIIASSTLLAVFAVVAASILFIVDRYTDVSIGIHLYPLVLFIISAVKGLSRSVPKWLFKAFARAIKYLKGSVFRFIIELFQKDYFEKAQQIKNHLGDDVQIVIFGHSHDADRRPDKKDPRKTDDKLRYFNVGTWTPVFSEEERVIREEKQFAFVRIGKKTAGRGKGGGCNCELCRWNECAAKPDELRLFERISPESGLIVCTYRAAKAIIKAILTLLDRIISRIGRALFG